MNKHNWAIHKRSLPVGLDKPILLNLTQEEAIIWLKRMKPRLIEYDQVTNIRVVHYYDKVRMDGHNSCIYSNDAMIIKE